MTFSPLQYTKCMELWLAISITCSNLQQKNQWNITCVEGRIFLIIIFHVIQHQPATKCKKISGHSGLLPLFCPFQNYIQLQSDTTESSNCLIEILRFTPDWSGIRNIMGDFELQTHSITCKLICFVCWTRIGDLSIPLRVV